MRHIRPLTTRRALVGALLVPTLVVMAPAVAASAAARPGVMSSAASLAKAKGYQVGIAVLDTKTGHFYGSGDYRGVFASESIVKVFIAARLLVWGEMHGHTEALAYKMITQSDDSIATSFYNHVGGDSLIDWVKKYFNVGSLGYRPSRPGWWGNTHIRPSGLVRLYAKLKADRRVGPWLLNAMHHATRYGSDGTYQYFGLPSATTGAAIKQGWGDDAGYGATADFNTTGFINNDRYAVAILARGPSSSYGSPIGSLLTSVAKRLLPGGKFPDPTPTLTSLSQTSGRIAGGTTVIVHGTDLTGTQAVYFGARRATSVDRLSAFRLRVVAPGHSAGPVSVHVVTDHGRSATTSRARYTYLARPRITTVLPAAGAPEGGTAVTITGTGFDRVTRVRFGTTAGSALHVLSSTRLRVTAPAHAGGPVDIIVTTAYGTSTVRRADRFSYLTPAPPAP
jgi:IPT/TIG domain